jgi:hypothetical protein
MNQTQQQYQEAIDQCKSLFMKKASDYGTAWRILRTTSLTDQIFIKANRIRTIQETGKNKVGEEISAEFIGIVNYGIMALIQLELPNDLMDLEIPLEKVETLYDRHSLATKSLMETKNHDYGEAWRDMRISSLTDLILMKILRVKQIENNQGKTLVSEGVDANYMDMVNYALFALIKLKLGEE